MKETRRPKRRKRDRQGNRMALIGIVFVIFSMALEEKRVYVQTKQYIEKVAKEKLGLVNPDEIILKAAN